MDKQELFRLKLGLRIKLRRASLGLSQTELAEKLGYSEKSAISKIESGKNEPPASKLEAFAEVLETSVPYLMGWEQNETDVTDAEYEMICRYRRASEYHRGKVDAILEDYKEDTSFAAS